MITVHFCKNIDCKDVSVDGLSKRRHDQVLAKRDLDSLLTARQVGYTQVLSKQGTLKFLEKVMWF